MHRLAFLLVVLGCGNPQPKPATPTSPTTPTKRELSAVADVKGVVVTKSDVLFDGKSLGVSPTSLVDDRRVLTAAIGAAKATDPRVLSYTDDAPAPVVLAAMRAFGEVSSPPVVKDSGSATADGDRARAIEAARTTGILGGARLITAYSINVLADGKPKKLCDARAAGAPADDERVDLAVTLGSSTWQVALTRVNDIDKPTSIEGLANKLKEYKQSAFFVDRTDVELAAEPGTRGADLTPVLVAACAVGFFELRPVTLTEIAAQLAGHRVAIAPPERSAISIGQPNAQGDLDKAIIRRYIKRNLQKLSSCYEHELLTKPKLKGTVEARFEIAANGTVEVSEASGVDPAVASCVAATIKAIEFPKPKDGKVVQVAYPFTFAPPQQVPVPAARP